jgi:hypothetical protein
MLKIKTNVSTWRRRLGLLPSQFNFKYTKRSNNTIEVDYIISTKLGLEIALKQVKYRNQEVIEFFENKVLFEETIPIADLATIINNKIGSGFTRNSLFRVLRDLKFLKTSTNPNIQNDPYDSFVDNGIFVKVSWNEYHPNSTYSFHQTRVPSLGVKFFVDLLTTNISTTHFKIAYP